MRISETLSLTINDINKNAIDIVGKGNKHRMVFVPKALNKIWINYCRNGRSVSYTHPQNQLKDSYYLLE